MTYLRSLAAASKLPYVNITVDFGAAINSYKFLWSIFMCFKNVSYSSWRFSFHERKFSGKDFFPQGQYE